MNMKEMKTENGTEKKEDRRVRRTKKLLSQGLIELMQHKQVKDITVRELAERVDVNRGTFYLYYRDIFDLLERLAVSYTHLARRIRMELRQKGVDSEAIDEALSAIDHDDMLSGALKAARKAASGKNLADPKDRQKIFAALARRGYGYAEARQALEALKDEQE